MRILVVGSGGREHALCWAIAASPLCDKLYCAPGNAGIARIAECVLIGAEDVDALVRFARESAIDFVVIGPEAPLVLGLADRLEAAGIRTFGPSQRAAALEGSKGFMKDLCAKYGIPTAAYARFDNAEKARAYVRAHGAPIVVKADGLAAGKGVTVAMTLEAALAAIDDAMVANRFGKAGAEVVIEEYLEGEEVSFFALCDGTHAVPLAAAQDHKRVGEGDTGPNTGGMGAYSPPPAFTEALRGNDVAQRTYERAVAQFGERGVVELVVTAGYYTTLAMVMNLARTPVPPGAPVLPARNRDERGRPCPPPRTGCTTRCTAPVRSRCSSCPASAARPGAGTG